MIFDAHDWRRLATLFTCGEDWKPYPGYKPNVAEAPNGDTRECSACDGLGHSVDVHDEGFGELCSFVERCPTCAGSGRVPNVAPPTTRYLHVAPKYNPPAWAMAYLARAHYEACRVAEALGVPAAYYPRVADGTLRVLEYDVGGSQPEHIDFDLFTIVLYRSHPADLEHVNGFEPGKFPTVESVQRFQDAEYISPGVHIGELGELVGLGPATPHRVPARNYRQQSCVYFAMPDHAARLPCPHGHTGFDCGAHGTVGKWLKERLARSRVYK